MGKDSPGYLYILAGNWSSTDSYSAVENEYLQVIIVSSFDKNLSLYSS